MRHEEPKLTRFWVGLSLLIWGSFTDQLALGVTLAVVAELGRYLPFKWELTDSHFYRIADLTSVLFAIVTVYQFNEHSIYGIYRILALLPVCIFPLLVAERYSTTGALPLSALFLSLRRRVRAGVEQERFVGVALPYVIVCILAASAGDVPRWMYLASAFVLAMGALFSQRARRYNVSTWVTTTAVVALVAFGIQLGIGFAQRQVEDSFSYWMRQFAWFQTDPNRERTAIGTIGRLKLSDRIRVRFTAPLSIPLPVMLHEASYSEFDLGTWSSTDSQMIVVDPVPEHTEWILKDGASDPGGRSATIIIDHVRDVGVAPLPYGTTKIFGSEVIEVQRNRYNTTLVEAFPGQLEYGVSWRSNERARTPPDAADLAVPDNYAKVLDQAAVEIGLQHGDPDAAVAQVTKFFRDRFKYSLIQKGFYPGRMPLSDFLMHNRKGHCEYFATATALLLRHAGIPTRYAVGYLIDEYSPLEKAFVGRARHAHSWVEAFIDDRWITVDTTPSEWSDLERENASSWQYVQDLWAWITNRYQRFQRTDHGSFADTLIWLVPPLILLLIWRLRKRVRNVSGDQPQGPVRDTGRGLDSELYRLSNLLRDRGYTLNPGDTLGSFLGRNVKEKISGANLGRLLELHYRYRFAEHGLSLAERKELRYGGEQFCQRYENPSD